MDNQQPQQQAGKGNVNLNMDTTPVFFTDIIFWNVSNDGVVLNFGQTVFGPEQVKIVSRMGMSREFAKRFLKDLGTNMALTEAQGQTGKEKS